MNEEYGNHDGCKYHEFSRTGSKCACNSRINYYKQVNNENKILSNRNDDFRFRNDSHERGPPQRNYFPPKDFPRNPPDYQTNLRPQPDNSRSNEDFRAQYPPRISEDKRRSYCPSTSQYPRPRTQTQSSPEMANRNRQEIYKGDRFPQSTSYVYSDSRGPVDNYGSKGDHCRCKNFEESSDNECDLPRNVYNYNREGNRNLAGRKCNCCEYDCDCVNENYCR